MSNAASPLAPPKLNGAASPGCIIPFGLLFAAIGCVAFYSITLRPLLRASASSNWNEVPCEILASKVERKSDSHGSTYRVAVRYRYKWSGRAYEGYRYDFSAGSTSVGVKKMRAAVAALPPGKKTVCYIDPASPDSAVLTRETGFAVWIGALTLLFPLFGLGMIYSSWRSQRTDRSPLGRALPNGTRTASNRIGIPPMPDPEVPGEVVLKPATGRVGTFVAIACFALFWNGGIGFMLFNVIKDFRGGFMWFPLLFMIPFVGVGLVMIVIALHTFSRLFAPSVEVRLDPSLLRLGSRVPFTWRLGNRGVHKLTIRLIGREEATYQQGTRTTTDKSDFHRSVLFDSSDTLSLNEGRGELILPSADAAPAFTEPKNRLIWELVFTGEIPWRADVDDRFTLPVRGPARPLGLTATPEPRAHTGGGLTLWTVDRFAPGETIVFTVSREASAKPDPLSLQLGWFTEGKGTRDAAVAWREALPDLAPGTDRSFEVQLHDDPWSFTGHLVAVEWRLEVLDSDRNPLVAVPLIIAPGGQIVNLPALPKEASFFEKRKARFRSQVAR
ncbi:hypothetical protein IMCC26134_11205 [Verrucomicrobia bacterium IMCC26134]|nr:hypothetical protein IMCC26134_11205 [Verrucomicrobia bacterium IMCC26134]